MLSRTMPSKSDSQQEELAAHVAGWIKAEVEASGGVGAAFGLSGGLDSAVVAALAKRAFPHHTMGVVMPCHSDPQDQQDALLVAHHFGIATAFIDLGPVYDTLMAQLARVQADLPENRLSCANVKPRLRMTTLYAFANHMSYRVLGTGNRSEIEIGYFTKYGDGGVDLLPIGNFTKTQIRTLAWHLGVPRSIIEKPPSAGLWAGQTDEEEMGITYEELDAYLVGKRRGHERIDALTAASQHKRALPRVAPLPTAKPAARKRPSARAGSKTGSSGGKGSKKGGGTGKGTGPRAGR
jgi:NAD+ synthase